MLSRLSLRTKITALVVIIVAVSMWTFGKLAFSGLIEMLTKSSGLGVLTAASTVADAVDPQWLQSVNAGQPDAQYLQLQQRLHRVVNNGYVKRAGVVRFDEGLTVEHLISLPVDSTADYFPPGTRKADEVGGLYTQRSPGYHVWAMEEPGTYMAGWIPIRVEGHAPVGLVYLIVDANNLQHAMNTVSVAIFSVMGAFILLSGLVAYKFASTFEKTAVTDGLMGIYNHKFFKQRLEQEVAKSARYGQQTSLVMLDIDFFKRVNDTYGHATGDLVLKQLARWVTETARNTDVIARYGGEEIAMILTHTGLAGAQEFAERLRLKVSQQVIKDPEEDAEFRVTVSIGVTQWEKGVSSLDMVKRADAALYHSKRSGRNRVTIYQEEILPAPEPQPKTGS